MKYSVHKKYLNAIIVFFVIPFCFLPFAAALDMGGTEDKKMLLFTGIVGGVMLLAAAIGIYVFLRPYVKADGEKVIYYPMWGRKREVDISAIDSRRETEKLDLSTWLYRSAGHTVVCKVYKYTYFIGEKEVMKIYSDMVNAERLDAMIKDRLPAENEE